ncbi:MAG: RNA polymerase sigma-70 factor [Gemmatimonadaceae bacterium]
MDERESTIAGGHTLEVLFRGHYATLCEYVYHLVRCREVAEDLVQDLFVRLWELKADAAPGTLAEPYLYKAARNRALRYLKHQRVEQCWADASMIGPDAPVSASPMANQSTETQDLADAIEAAIGRLPDRCRLIFIMSRSQQLTYGEIARTLEISLSTVETQMGRALKRLRAQLAPYLTLIFVPILAFQAMLAAAAITP